MLLSFDETRERIAESIRHIRPAHVAIAALAVTVFLAILTDGDLFPLVLLAVVIGLVLLWANEFLTLMRAPDDAFPGRFDKLIWGLALLLIPPVGGPVFWIFRKAHWPEAAPRAKPRPGAWPHDGL